ncbi:hypothetical protein [Streptomyces lincolnensis]|nr:hypothetical protein [Streptomyces lincolnensis]
MGDLLDSAVPRSTSQASRSVGERTARPEPFFGSVGRNSGGPT